MGAGAEVRPRTRSGSRFVSNASPLIALTQIGRLQLLNDLLGEIVIPPVVRNEIEPTIPNPPAWMVEYRLPFALHSRVTRAGLDRGETEALGLAIHLRAPVIILDDRSGRRLGAMLNLEVVETLGVLLRAKRERRLSAVRPEINALAAVGFYLSPELRRLALEESRRSIGQRRPREQVGGERPLP